MGVIDYVRRRKVSLVEEKVVGISDVMHRDGVVVSEKLKEETTE